MVKPPAMRRVLCVERITLRGRARAADSVIGPPEWLGANFPQIAVGFGFLDDAHQFLAARENNS
jgi:hypothetical protein